MNDLFVFSKQDFINWIIQIFLYCVPYEDFVILHANFLLDAHNLLYLKKPLEGFLITCSLQPFVFQLLHWDEELGQC